jgi:hypothetical protein
MKKSLIDLMTILMVIIVSVGLAACSSNDDDSAFSSIDLVGTWKSVGKGRFYTFHADGTFEGSSTYSNWRLSDNKLLLTRSNNGRIEEWLVEYKDNLLYLTLPDGSATEYKTLMKVDLGKMPTLTNNYFVGKWEHSSCSMEFGSNGSLKVYYSDNRYLNATGIGTWKFNTESQTLSTTAKFTWVTYDYKGRAKDNVKTEEYSYKIIYATDDEWAGDGFSYMRVK